MDDPLNDIPIAIDSIERDGDQYRVIGYMPDDGVIPNELSIGYSTDEVTATPVRYPNIGSLSQPWHRQETVRGPSRDRSIPGKARRKARKGYI